jgi:hypothetical protein
VAALVYKLIIADYRKGGVAGPFQTVAESDQLEGIFQVLRNVSLQPGYVYGIKKVEAEPKGRQK